MDPKMIEMNNLRVLNDYLTQTLEVLGRSPRPGVAAGHPGTLGYSPFSPFAGGLPGQTAGLCTDSVYGQGQFGQSPFAQGPWGFGSPMYPSTPFAAQHPFTGAPVYGAGYGVGYGAQDPFLAQRSFGGWPQQPWGGISEVSRQAQFTQALAAKQSVLEAMCRACGIPC